jgi:hypothetical protein
MYVCALHFTYSQNELLTQNAVYFMYIVINIPCKLFENKLHSYNHRIKKTFIDGAATILR